MSVDVAIIGGGVSGLSAALRLAESGARVAVLEQAQKLGGRCYSFRDEATGDVVDNGQHVLVGAYRHTLAYLETIGTRQYLKREESIPFFHAELGSGRVRMSTLPRPFHLIRGICGYSLLPLRERLEAFRVGLFLAQWSASSERLLRGLSVEQWLGTLGQSEAARRFLWHPLCISIMNESPERASALLFARSLALAFLGPSRNAAILIPTVGQTELYVEPACRFLAERGARIETGAEVTAIALAGGRVTGVRFADGRMLAAGAVIAAVPPHALKKIVPPPFALAPPFDELGSFSASPIVSVHLWFDRELLGLDYVGLVDREMQWIFNRRRIVGPGGTPGYLSAVISGAYRHVDLPKEELVALALNDIRALAPESRDARLLFSIVVKEKRATFSATAEAEQLRPSSSTPIGNFYLAGDWTDTGYPATIEGAILSGVTAAALASNQP